LPIFSDGVCPLRSNKFNGEEGYCEFSYELASSIIVGNQSKPH